MMRRLSASRLEIAALCPGMAHLPWLETTNEHALAGRAIHEYLARRLGGEEHESALGGVPEPLRERCVAVDVGAVLDALGIRDARAEVAYAWRPDVDAAVELGVGLERDYSAAPDGALVGTADVVGRDARGVAVMDWKSGASFVAGPDTNLQLQFQALAAARCGGDEFATAHVPVIGADGTVDVRSAVYDAAGLAGIARRLSSLHRRVTTAGPADLSLGEHCARCPALLSCPAQRAATTALLAPEAAGALEEPAAVEAAWLACKAARAALDAVGGAIRARVLHGEVPLSDGRMLRIVRQWQDEVVGPTALAVLAEAYGPDVAHAAASVSKSAVTKAVGKEESKAALALLVERGAIQKRPVDKLMAVKVDREDS